jgi:hypothetical protein
VFQYTRWDTGLHRRQAITRSQGSVYGTNSDCEWQKRTVGSKSIEQFGRGRDVGKSMNNNQDIREYRISGGDLAGQNRGRARAAHTREGRQSCAQGRAWRVDGCMHSWRRCMAICYEDIQHRLKRRTGVVVSRRNSGPGPFPGMARWADQASGSGGSPRNFGWTTFLHENILSRFTGPYTNFCYPQTIVHDNISPEHMSASAANPSLSPSTGFCDLHTGLADEHVPQSALILP